MQLVYQSNLPLPPLLLFHLLLWAIKVVRVFHSFHEAIHKPRNQNSIHSFMTHPEFTTDELPPASFVEEKEKSVPKVETGMLLLDGEATPNPNRNNNSVDCNQVQIVASHPENPLQSLETSV